MAPDRCPEPLPVGPGRQDPPCPDHLATRSVAVPERVVGSIPRFESEGREAMRVGIYARVSTTDQTCDNQLLDLRRYVDARGWTVFKEFIDDGVSGAKERRPALD